MNGPLTIGLVSALMTLAGPDLPGGICWLPHRRQVSSWWLRRCAETAQAGRPADFARLPGRRSGPRTATAKRPSSRGCRWSNSSRRRRQARPKTSAAPALASYLVVEAADGYRAVFALPELAPGVHRPRHPARRPRAGSRSTADEGPLRVIVPGEKRHARWVRQVVTLMAREGLTASSRHDLSIRTSVDLMTALT